MNCKLGVAISTVVIGVLIAAFALTYHRTGDGKTIEEVVGGVANIETLITGDKPKKHSPRPQQFVFNDLGGKGFAKGRLVEVFCIDGYKYVAMTRHANGVSLGLVQAREMLDGQEVLATCNQQ